MKASQLDLQHPDYSRMAQFWRHIDLLYRGGQAIRDNAEQFLFPRPMEPHEMYAIRKQRLSYQNILSTALGWYSSALFCEEPKVLIKPSTPDYITKFMGDADRAGTSLVDLARSWWLRAVLDGSVYVLLDLPESKLAQNFREQTESGALDAYLVTFRADQVINWDTDRYGNLEWVVIRTQMAKAAIGQKQAVTDRWYYFDRQKFEIWEAGEKKHGQEDREAVKVSEGFHSTALFNRVPVRKIEIDESLWLGYRVTPQVIDHLNQDNSLAWGLFMGCVAMPVIKSDDDPAQPKISEASYLKLGQNDDFFWAEPAGTAFQIAADRVNVLRQEIYRQMYLQAQARDASATASAQSGYSKEMDMAPSNDVLNGYGRVLRRHLTGILRQVAEIRKQQLEVEVHGFAFEDDLLSDIDAARQALDIGVPSKAFEAQVYKRIARKYIGGGESEVLKTIDQEIDAAPSRQERLAAMTGALRVSQPAPFVEPQPGV